MAQFNQPVQTPMSPTIESLCQDLDFYIHELNSDSSPSTEDSAKVIQQLDVQINANSHMNNSDGREQFRYDWPVFNPAIMENYDQQNNSNDQVPFIDTTLDSYSYITDSENTHQWDSTVDNHSGLQLMPNAYSTMPTPIIAIKHASASSSFEDRVIESFSAGHYEISESEDILGNPPRSSSLHRHYSGTSPSQNLHGVSSIKRSSRPRNLEKKRTPKTYVDPESDIMVIGSILTGKSLAKFAYKSKLSKEFIQEVQILSHERRLFCAEIYPNSFTGAEAMKILQTLLQESFTDKTYLRLGRSLLHTWPPVIAPLIYSEKATKNNAFYDSTSEFYTIVEDTMDRNMPQGIYVQLTTCYVPTCTPESTGCYSTCCPNRPVKLRVFEETEIETSIEKPPKVQRQKSLNSSLGSRETGNSVAWAATIDRSVLVATPSDEIKRQEGIYEFIYSEEDYFRDLNLLEELFAKPLSDAQCIEPDRRQEFCEKAFANHLELIAIHKELCQDLRDCQTASLSNEKPGFVDGIGPILLKHVYKFLEPYVKYGPQIVLSGELVDTEIRTNILFKNFINGREKRAEARKLSFNHFHFRPIARLQRYLLLIDPIIKATKDDTPDKKDLEACKKEIKKVASLMDEGVGHTKMKLRITKINEKIIQESGTSYDFGLLEPQRRLIYEGIMLRRTTIVTDPIEMYLFLFDHMLIITKLKRPSDSDQSSQDHHQYYLHKSPIPLELLVFQESSSNLIRGILPTPTLSSNPLSTPKANSTFQNGVNTPAQSSFFGQASITIQHLGNDNEETVLFENKKDDLAQWNANLANAKKEWEAVKRETEPYEVQVLSDSNFAYSSNMGSKFNHGKVTCSVPYAATNGKRMVAIGTQNGVWIGASGSSSFQKVLSALDVTQIDVLEEHRILLVLSEKVVYGYQLDTLDGHNQKKPVERVPQRISQHVSYFSTGVIKGKTLLVVMKRKGMDSQFKAFEPVCGDLRDPKNAKFLTTKTSFLSKPPAWFKLYKEFYVGADSSAIHFLNARLMVVCIRGFEVIDLDNLRGNRNLPDLKNPEFDFVVRHGEYIQPLGMFKCSSEDYVLCYDKFAFNVDIRGKFSKHNYERIEWEGTPQSVAFDYPYIIAFNARFIEIRHVLTGKLVQVIAGENMGCLQYKKPSYSKQPLVHGVMQHPFKTDFQTVFQLTSKGPMP
ncbi:CNH domain-containing protein [Phycomyces nitens]|nr:CNH domain-containing protein [Phycomyces nitens]